eukprot:Skav219794  [mRNA]  locus=scaffold147:71351:72832:+ [translate_table: standard]
MTLFSLLSLFQSFEALEVRGICTNCEGPKITKMWACLPTAIYDKKGCERSQARCTVHLTSAGQGEHSTVLWRPLTIARHWA